ncbi:hypothetical protein HK099_004917 [Clydaea vesicula]|uniref:Uncharacterized protein n=1 Tax=Clydaea vesicula TaxID=447962 RepID=A0AAD5U4H0_9FUNG|nr:hypothetical protein HK099_004917 [Clydaea vesicula]
MTLFIVVLGNTSLNPREVKKAQEKICPVPVTITKSVFLTTIVEYRTKITTVTNPTVTKTVTKYRTKTITNTKFPPPQSQNNSSSYTDSPSTSTNHATVDDIYTTEFNEVTKVSTFENQRVTTSIKYFSNSPKSNAVSTELYGVPEETTESSAHVTVSDRYQTSPSTQIDNANVVTDNYSSTSAGEITHLATLIPSSGFTKGPHQSGQVEVETFSVRQTVYSSSEYYESTTLAAVAVDSVITGVHSISSPSQSEELNTAAQTVAFTEGTSEVYFPGELTSGPESTTLYTPSVEYSTNEYNNYVKDSTTQPHIFSTTTVDNAHSSVEFNTSPLQTGVVETFHESSLPTTEIINAEETELFNSEIFKTSSVQPSDSIHVTAAHSTSKRPSHSQSINTNLEVDEVSTAVFVAEETEIIEFSTAQAELTSTQQGVVQVTEIVSTNSRILPDSTTAVVHTQWPVWETDVNADSSTKVIGVLTSGAEATNVPKTPTTTYTKEFSSTLYNQWPHWESLSSEPSFSTEVDSLQTTKSNNVVNTNDVKSTKTKDFTTVDNHQISETVVLENQSSNEVSSNTAISKSTSKDFNAIYTLEEQKTTNTQNFVFTSASESVSFTSTSPSTKHHSSAAQTPTDSHENPTFTEKFPLETPKETTEYLQEFETSTAFENAAEESSESINVEDFETTTQQSLATETSVAPNPTLTSVALTTVITLTSVQPETTETIPVVTTSTDEFGEIVITSFITRVIPAMTMTQTVIETFPTFILTNVTPVVTVPKYTVTETFTYTLGERTYTQTFVRTLTPTDVATPAPLVRKFYLSF